MIAGLAALFAFFPIFHLIFGIIMMLAPMEVTDEMRAEMNSEIPEGAEYVPMLFGLFFVIIAGSIMLFGWLFAFLTFLAGRYLTKQKNYVFCLVMAGVICMFFPFGTVLGVFTIIVLMRDSVRESFGR